MATSQELISDLIHEAATLTAVFREYRTSLDASVTQAVTKVTTLLEASMLSNIASYNNAVVSPTYFVDAKFGVDTNNGTSSATPFKTIKKALALGKPFMSMNIALCKGQVHTIRGIATVLCSVRFSSYSTADSIAIEPRTGQLINWKNITGTSVSFGGSTATALAFDDFCSCNAVIQFEEQHGIDITAFNTQFSTDAEVTAYAASPTWAGRNSSSGFQPELFSTQNKTLAFSTIVVQGPRWDKVKPSYRKILKTNSSSIVAPVEHFGVLTVASYGTVFKPNFGRLVSSGGGPGSYNLTLYGTLVIKEKLWSLDTDKRIINSSGIMIIDKEFPFCVWSDGVDFTINERTAAFATNVIFPKSTSTTNDIATAINIICPDNSITSKSVTDGLVALESYRYI